MTSAASGSGITPSLSLGGQASSPAVKSALTVENLKELLGVVKGENTRRETGIFFGKDGSFVKEVDMIDGTPIFFTLGEMDPFTKFLKQRPEVTFEDVQNKLKDLNDHLADKKQSLSKVEKAQFILKYFDFSIDQLVTRLETSSPEIRLSTLTLSDEDYAARRSLDPAADANLNANNSNLQKVLTGIQWALDKETPFTVLGILAVILVALHFIGFDSLSSFDTYFKGFGWGFSALCLVKFIYNFQKDPSNKQILMSFFEDRNSLLSFLKESGKKFIANRQKQWALSTNCEKGLSVVITALLLIAIPYFIMVHNHSFGMDKGFKNYIDLVNKGDLNSLLIIGEVALASFVLFGGMFAFKRKNVEIEALKREIRELENEERNLNDYVNSLAISKDESRAFKDVWNEKKAKLAAHNKQVKAKKSELEELEESEKENSYLKGRSTAQKVVLVILALAAISFGLMMGLHGNLASKFYDKYINFINQDVAHKFLIIGEVALFSMAVVGICYGFIYKARKKDEPGFLSTRTAGQIAAIMAVSLITLFAISYCMSLSHNIELSNKALSSFNDLSIGIRVPALTAILVAMGALTYYGFFYKKVINHLAIDNDHWRETTNTRWLHDNIRLVVKERSRVILKSYEYAAFEDLEGVNKEGDKSVTFTEKDVPVVRTGISKQEETEIIEFQAYTHEGSEIVDPEQLNALKQRYKDEATTDVPIEQLAWERTMRAAGSLNKDEVIKLTKPLGLVDIFPERTLEFSEEQENGDILILQGKVTPKCHQEVVGIGVSDFKAFLKKTDGTIKLCNAPIAKQRFFEAFTSLAQEAFFEENVQDYRVNVDGERILLRLSPIPKIVIEKGTVKEYYLKLQAFNIKESGEIGDEITEKVKLAKLELYVNENFLNKGLDPRMLAKKDLQTENSKDVDSVIIAAGFARAAGQKVTVASKPKIKSLKDFNGLVNFNEQTETERLLNLNQKEDEERLARNSALKKAEELARVSPALAEPAISFERSDAVSAPQPVDERSLGLV